ARNGPQTRRRSGTPPRGGPLPAPSGGTDESPLSSPLVAHPQWVPPDERRDDSSRRHRIAMLPQYFVSPLASFFTDLGLQSRRSLPVRLRKTSSRLGERTSTPRSSIPCPDATATTAGSTAGPWSVVSSRCPSTSSTSWMPSRPRHAAASASRSAPAQE